MVKSIDFAAIDAEAACLVERGAKLCDNILTYLANFIDITDPYSVMLAVKKVGVKNLVEALSDGVDDLGAMPTDYDLYTH